MSPSSTPTRAAFVAGAGAATVFAPGAVRAAGKPEKPNVRFGLAVDSAFFMPVYVAQAKTWSNEGLSPELVAFRGDSQVAQALAGDSVDVMIGSIIGLIQMISAEQPVKGFYAGLNFAGFEWLAKPAIKRWSDLRGKSVGVATFGSLTDSLTRYVLAKNGLVPERDVNIVEAGNAANTYQGIVSGRLDAGILSSPYTWQAQSAGLTVLGTQEKDVGAVWPAQAFSAKTAFVAANPNTIVALLRAHVAALRLIAADHALAAAVLHDKLKLPESEAVRSVDEDVHWYDERGRLPADRFMNVFWQIETKAGLTPTPWPASRYIDTHYIDSFGAWAPKG